jgi:hypothetical protein
MNLEPHEIGTMALTPLDNPGGQTGYLPKGTAAAPYEHTLAGALASPGASWDLEPRIGVLADDDTCQPFTGAVVSWDAHVYFDGTDPLSVESALALRFDVLRDFPCLTVNRPYRSPIGPHPTSM